MASTITAETEDFARRMFRLVEQRAAAGAGGAEWLAARDAFEQTVAAHPDHAYVAYLAGHRARRAGFVAVAERIRAAEFPQIERRKQGTARNAPVLYRVGGPGVSFDLHLPYVCPPSHPLLSQRRQPAGDHEPALPARLMALTDPPARSVWRRRLSAGWRQERRAAQAAWWSPQPWWPQLRRALARLFAQLRARTGR
jgi:hypothetical protein